MVSSSRKAELLFPYKEVRDEQNKLLLLTAASIENKRNLIVHAPTGLGKTAATISPALSYALDNDKTVLFLTSRHTQHKIAIETLKEIKHKFDVNFGAVSIIGKKWMCLQPGVETLYSSEFADYCKRLREEKKCSFYTNARKSQTKFTTDGENLLKKLQMIAPLTTEQVLDHSSDNEMCAYEISLGLASKAKVIITDYYYFFHPDIVNNFLLRIGKEIENLIVIVDEAHNLPYRLKDLASEYLTSISLSRALKEAKKYNYDSTADILQEMIDYLEKMAQGMKIGEEKVVSRLQFEKHIDDSYDYDQVKEDFDYIADAVRELQKQSYIGSISAFMEKWQGQEDGFVRILSVKQGLKGPFISLSYRCLDPSVVSRELINNTHSTIMMSGTLLPTSMYKELLGVEDVQEVVFKDPFPKKNRLNLIVPKTTTKYSARNDSQFTNIAETLAQIVDDIPGNVAVFFPSYFVMDKVKELFDTKTKKTVFSENSKLNKTQKNNLLEDFKGYKDIGAVLLAVASGSFGEGIDLPGDLLKAVIVVGLPLGQPDLEIKSLIEYFDKKFKKGWDYGYLFPAFNKTLQNAGRCIRSETDKGMIIFLDERYVWSNYRKCFPEDWDLAVSQDYKDIIEEFFSKL